MSNDVYYETRAPVLYGGTISLQVLSTLVVILRFVARRVAKAGLWWDDWLIVPALVWNISNLSHFLGLQEVGTNELEFSCLIGASARVPGIRFNMPDSVVTQKLLVGPSRSSKSSCFSRLACLSYMPLIP